MDGTQNPLDKLRITYPGGTSTEFCTTIALPGADAAAVRIARRARRHGHSARLAGSNGRLGGGCADKGRGDCAGDGEGDDEATNDDFHGSDSLFGYSEWAQLNFSLDTPDATTLGCLGSQVHENHLHNRI